MADKRTQFVIDSLDGPKCIFEVIERKNGDLIIPLRDATRRRVPGVAISSESDAPDHGMAITQSRYSVHRTERSVNGVNVLKYTSTLADGTENTHVINTTSIKKSAQFQVLWGRRSSRMTDDYFAPSAKAAATVKIGRYNEDFFTLVFFVLVGPSSRIFSSSARNFNVHRVVFGGFCVVILWSYLPLPAHESAFAMHFPSAPDWLSSGVDETGVVDMFDIFRDACKQELTATLISGDYGWSADGILKTLEYFKHANMTSPSYRSWMLRAGMSLDS